MPWDHVISFLVALTTSGTLLAVGRGVWRHLTGGQDRERRMLRDAWADRDAAEARADKETARADEEARCRRVAVEHAHHLVVQLIAAGVAEDDIRPFPSTTPKEKP